jgi:hypothetical protein
MLRGCHRCSLVSRERVLAIQFRQKLLSECRSFRSRHHLCPGPKRRCQRGDRVAFRSNVSYGSRPPDFCPRTLKVLRSAVGSGSGRPEPARPMSQLGRHRPLTLVLTSDPFRRIFLLAVYPGEGRFILTENSHSGSAAGTGLDAPFRPFIGATGTR